MAQKKSSTQTSPWFTVSMGIAGLVIGYGLVLQQAGAMSPYTGNVQCPLKAACASGACSPACPGNCNHPS